MSQVVLRQAATYCFRIDVRRLALQDMYAFVRFKHGQIWLPAQESLACCTKGGLKKQGGQVSLRDPPRVHHKDHALYIRRLCAERKF